MLSLIAFAVAAPTPRGLAQQSPHLVTETIAHGLDTPWALDFAPDGRIFITERPGRVRVIEHGQLQAEPWILLEVTALGEGGLMGLALDPQFDRNRFVYVAYTVRDGEGKLQNRLARLRENRTTGKGVFDKVLVDNVAGAHNHNGGRLKFGPDGKLYWTTGDAQMTNLAQNLTSLNGKILRLNTDGSVPSDNPFADSYVYSYGHRNPQGLAWQPGTNRIYATEHGPSGFQGCCRDELNYIKPGKNYGWPTIRGDESKEGMVSPVLNSGTREIWAPAGAAFSAAGPWAGSLLFTGLRGQTLYRAVLDANDPRKATLQERLLHRQFGRLRDVVSGADHSLYLLTSNRDGRGRPKDGDDQIIRLTVK